ncbi:MAG TPA: recombination factor protein RarA, partial [Gemmatimonadales bacterium]|nr:recombination factor protein RarA [Gemmatimonadales bacterium]
TPAAPVPMHIRNAPTGLMKELGYGRGYRYAHDSPDAYLPQEYLPDALRGAAFYVPGLFGHEKRVAERMEWWARKRADAEGAPPASGESRADREAGEAREGGDR